MVMICFGNRILLTLHSTLEGIGFRTQLLKLFDIRFFQTETLLTVNNLQHQTEDESSHT